MKKRLSKTAVWAISIVGFALMSGCASGPDQGRYTMTEKEVVATNYGWPREKPLLLVVPNHDYACLKDIVKERAAELSIRTTELSLNPDDEFLERLLADELELTPADTDTLLQSLVMLVIVENKKGPSGSWNPNSGAITSSLKRTELTVLVFDPETQAILWAEEACERKLLECTDRPLLKMARQVVNCID